jgi:hypothetical protein
MTHLFHKIAGLSVALLSLSVAGPSQAYTFGKLMGGQTLSRDEGPGSNQCVNKVQDNLEAYENVNGVEGAHVKDPNDPTGWRWVENIHVWGQQAKELLQKYGMPAEIDDDGQPPTYCAQYTGSVSLIIDGAPQTFHPGVNFHDGFSVVAHSSNQYPQDYYVQMYKASVCAGHNNWHASRGAGGRGWSWGVYGNYYKSGL